MKAMILAAGMGTRLGALTQDRPKPLLDINGQPILAYILANLAAHGFGDVVINLHYHGEAIAAALGDGARYGTRITYLYEDHLLGTAGSVKHAETLLRGPDPFLVHYGDVLTNQDLGAMAAFHRNRSATLTLLLHQRARSNSIVCLDAEQRVERLMERPDEAARATVSSPWVNSGVYLMAPSVLDAIPPGLACDFPRDVFPAVIAAGRAFGFPLQGYRCAIDSAQRLDQARADMPGLSWPGPSHQIRPR
jgi:NDP-sugar pyrophosphorylase family protein